MADKQARKEGQQGQQGSGQSGQERGQSGPQRNESGRFSSTGSGEGQERNPQGGSTIQGRSNVPGGKQRRGTEEE